MQVKNQTASAFAQISNWHRITFPLVWWQKLLTCLLTTVITVSVHMCKSYMRWQPRSNRSTWESKTTISERGRIHLKVQCEGFRRILSERAFHASALGSRLVVIYNLTPKMTLNPGPLKIFGVMNIFCCGIFVKIQEWRWHKNGNDKLIDTR